MLRRRSQYKEGTNFGGGGPRNLSAVPGAPGLGRSPINTWTEAAGHGAVIALDPATGREKWKFKMTDVTDSGILTTGSDLLFTGGREGYFQALDARTGSLLWKTQSGRVHQQRPDQLSRRQSAVRVRSCPGSRCSCSRSTNSGATCGADQSRLASVQISR